MPTTRQWLALLFAILIVLPLAPLLWNWIGTEFISPADLLRVVTHRGFRARWLLPLALYFVPVNAVLEELFWRGVILNELRGSGRTVWTLGAFWTALTFAAWHYLVLRLLLRPGWAEAAVLLILAAGIFLAWLYRQTRTIAVPILWHGLVFDLSLIVIFAAALRAFSAVRH
jgi:membrane protease YdiL (CAAX protease family)